MDLKRLALLCLLLTACAHNPERVPSVRIVPVDPQLVEPIAEPKLGGSQNKDLLNWIDALRAALKRANGRLQSIGQLGK